MLKEKERLESIDVKSCDAKMMVAGYHRMTGNITKRRDKTTTKLESLNPQNASTGQKLEHAFNVTRNMPEILFSGRLEHKIQLLGSMFPEKIEFDGEKYRTNSYNKVLEWISQNTNDLQNIKTENQDQKSVSSVSILHSYSGEGVPLTGRFYEPFLRDLELIYQVDSDMLHLRSP